MTSEAQDVLRMDEAHLPAPATPMEMLSRAVESGASMEVLEKLMALQERWEANGARKAFDAAVSAAKAEIPVVIKDGIGHNDKKHATLAGIARTVDPILSQHGLSYRFRTEQDDKYIIVTCILSHRDGHSEETTLRGPADTTGSKNAIQAIGSTLTYLQRYSLMLALGLAAAEDDDGRKGGAGDPITPDQLAELREALDATQSDVAAFCRFAKIDALPELPASKFDAAMARLREKAAKMGVR